MVLDETTIHHTSSFQFQYCNNLGDEMLMHIAEHCTQLQELQATNCPKISDIGVTAILKSNSMLTSLILGKGEHLQEAILWAITNNCPTLPRLDLCMVVKEAQLISLAQDCTLLQKLKLSSYVMVTNSAIIAVAENCPHLTTLELNSSFIGHITDISLHALAKHSKALINLALTMRIDVTVAGIDALLMNCKKLKSLLLHSRQQNAALRSFTPLSAAHCPQLEQLKVWNYDATDADSAAPPIEILGC